MHRVGAESVTSTRVIVGTRKRRSCFNVAESGGHSAATEFADLQ